ncbi:MAG: phage tail tube protein, partial [Pseudomonadota bacterium]
MLYSGSQLLVSIEINDDWQIIGGMRSTKFSLNNSLVDSSNISSGIWRELLIGSGLRSIDITVTGSFANSEAEQKIRSLALTGKIAKFQISFASGESLISKFQIHF